MGKILIVDDSATQRKKQRDLLEAFGYEVLEASNGAEGIEKYNSFKNEISLILCDINMPEMDGFEMLSVLQNSLKEKPIPIFMVTTESTPDMKSKGKSLGVRAWVTKPYQEQKLLAAIEKVLKP